MLVTSAPSASRASRSAPPLPLVAWRGHRWSAPHSSPSTSTSSPISRRSSSARSSSTRSATSASARGVPHDRARVHRAADRRHPLRPPGRPARPPHDPHLDGQHHGHRDRPHRPAARLRAGRLGRRRPAGAAAHRAGSVARRRVGRLHPARDRALRTREARVLRVDPAARLARRLDPLGRAVHRHDRRAAAEELAAWGWRIPFLVAFPLLAVSLYLRWSITETPGVRGRRGRGPPRPDPVPRHVPLASRRDRHRDRRGPARHRLVLADEHLHDQLRRRAARLQLPGPARSPRRSAACCSS